MPLVDVSSIPQVALAFQNDDHAEEGRLLNAVADALAALRERRGRREDVEAPLERLVTHTREHFERENAAMLEVGFPPYPVHRGEHDRVLAEMEAEARAFRDGGDAERLWAYVSSAVPAWFVNHIQTMDAITGQFVAARRG